uniref:Uncharacterized protein n=1 Tax=Cacopsylla melanoneura TaxID=428564 RepID=A0A8D9F9H5_9HEMI
MYSTRTWTRPSKTSCPIVAPCSQWTSSEPHQTGLLAGQYRGQKVAAPAACHRALCLSSFVLCFSMGCPLLLPLHSSHHKTWHLSFSFVLHYGVFHAVLVHPLYLPLVH